ncbi:hypothetical protein NW759_003899 [Fusarium solani]|nr:hypothetical protein NW759_003899 [Fusarium solani]
MTNCAESIDILMEAGCRLSFCNIEWAAASSECVMIVARRLFERREKLIQLAEDHLEAFEDECASHISDDVARFLYYELTSAGFPVDPALEVENWYTTVYHYPGLPLDHLQIFFEQGFRNHHGHDDLGLTPAMLWRDSLFSFEKDSEVDVNGYLSTLCWLEEEGFLDELPEDPHNIGLNTMSTGSHYLAALSCLYSSGNEASVVLPELSQSLARDDCVCWCIPGEHGCSPLGSILKAYADSDLEEKPCFWHQDLVGVLFSLGYDDTAIMTYFVRFLTFEALEMTHTCCHLGVFDRTFMKLVTNDDGNPAYEELYSDDSMGDMALVILDRDSNTIQETRTSKVERDNADLLNSLMKDFDRKLQGTEPTLETLQNFLRGYWRQRMARVFIVDDNAVDEMKTCLSNVQTYVLPERAQCFLPPGLDLRLTRR